jgi:hypothetical protein
MNNLDIYCITDKHFSYLDNLPYKKAGVGRSIFPKNYHLSNNLDNIFYKEKYYSELTFQYWFWKNKLHQLQEGTWIGFCQKRRFWIKKESIDLEINLINLKEHLLLSLPESLSQNNSIIVNSIFVNKVRKIKLIKRGIKSLIKNPSILFDESKQNVKLHFDMHHGHGNLDLAIDVMEDHDKKEFRDFVSNSVSFNPHIMFISKPIIANQWLSILFPWLFRCEKIFGFKNLYCYDSQRLYAYLDERYLYFWFRKYTKFAEWPIVTINNSELEEF